MTLKIKNQQRRLKERFSILQEYAHLMFLTEAGIINCRYGGVFSSADDECEDCDLKKECKYLLEKTATGLMDYDLNSVTEKMKVAQNYVERKAVHNIQDDGDCDCDPCSWLDEFNRVLYETLVITQGELKGVSP